VLKSRSVHLINFGISGLVIALKSATALILDRWVSLKNELNRKKNMKKIVFLTFLIISSLQSINSQEKNEKDLISSGKWYFEYLEMGGKKMNLPTEMEKTNWVLFHKGGKQEGMEDGKKYFGKWEFDEKKRILKTNDLEGKSEYKLYSVTKNKLIISIKQKEGEMIMGMKK
jgi:hypothetical protein